MLPTEIHTKATLTQKKLNSKFTSLYCAWYTQSIRNQEDVKAMEAYSIILCVQFSRNLQSHSASQAASV